MYKRFKKFQRGVMTMVPMKYKGLGFDRYENDAYNKEAAERAKALMAADGRPGGA